MKHAHGFLAVTSSDTTTTGSGKARHRRGQWGRRAFRATAIAAVAAVISTGAIAAVAAPTDSSNASARFLSGSLLTSAGTLDTLAALQGSTATNSGSPTADTETSSLDLSAVGGALTVDIPGGVTIPLSQFLQLGLVNQYAQASDNGVSRAASGAVSNGGIVDLSGTGAFPADAQIDLVNLLGNPAPGVLDTANVQLGAVTGVAALDAAVPGGPATSCADLSNPTNCRDYNIANASLNLHSPLVSQLVSSINTTLDATSATVNGLSSTLNASVLGTVNNLLGLLSGGTNDLNVKVSADLRTALSSVLSGSLSEGGVTLDLANGTITANLDTIIGGLNNRAPNTPLLSATVINAVVSDLGTILTTLQTNINAELTTALNAVPVTISGGVCIPVFGCDPTLANPLAGKLSLTYDGTLGDLAAGTAVIGANGTGAVAGPLGLVADLLTSTLASTLGGIAGPVVTNAISTVGTAATNAVTSLTTALDPVLAGISSVIGINLNVQEPGTAAGSYREVAARVSLLSGLVATVDLGRAEVGPNVVNAAVAPTITSIAPTHGPEAGGTVVTITGTGFTGATGVTFDGTSGTSFVVDSDTQITVTSPRHAPGPVDVVVQSPNGNSAPQTFTYDAAPGAPTITSIAPTHGPEAGGTVVTITGTGFTGATGVTFDGLPGKLFAVTSDTQITVTTPAHAPGATDVVVQSPNGDSAPGTFTFDPAATAPTITTLAPDHGPVTGGTPVTITGNGFTGATGVTFDGTSGTSFTVDSDTQITVTSPAHPVGPVDVVVQSPNGNSAPQTFTYNPVTTVTAVTPNSGPEAGGTNVLITGSCFAGATAVTFGGVAATSFMVINDTTISAVVPAGTGLVDVSVTGVGDCGTGTLPDAYTYLPAPVISGLSPDHGPAAGGTVVTITGTGFTGATGATFDGTPGAAFVVNSDTQITVTSPAHAPGATDVIVQSPNGDSAPGTFTFDAAPAAPTITTLAPDHGPETGGTIVTITGTGFTGATGVTFDGTPGTAFVVNSDTQITVTSPANAPGPADVVVLSPNGNSAPGTFTFDASPTAPSITALAPDHGPVTGGTVVTVTGTGLTGATGVTFDGIAGTAFTPISDSEATVTTPAHTQGAVPVVVQSPNGDSAPGTFTYEPVTTIDGVDPGSGPEVGGTSVTITGQCFTGATGVLFGTTPATSFTVVSDTEITAVAPAGTGTVDVTVVGAANCGTATDPGGYEYVPTPVILGIAPQQGPETGGTAVTVTGSGFTSATGVTFDGAAGTNFTVVSDTEITVTTPAHAPAAVDVVVTDPLRNSDPGTFTYTPVTAIDGVNPGEGPEDGGTTVTITGQCFTGATGVLFGTTPATSFTVVSDTEITAVSPAGVGTVDVTVTGAQGCGNATDPGGFTYVPDTTPVITGLTPTRGPEAGGTIVTITGSNFTGATDATFDGKKGTSFRVDSDTQITVTTPAHVAATVNVVVHGPDSVSSNAGAFTYYAVADIGGVDPGTGPTDGGTTVTISGKCFTGATGVLFGTTPAKSFTVVNDTTIRAVTPAGTGKVDVTVVGAGDCGSATLPHGFEYITAAAALARTGVDVLAGTWMSAFALMLAGLVLVAIRRRRSAE